jgi:MFS family permease
VSLVQAAITLPVFLVAVPAGALGDIVDRRRLMLVAQGLMLVATGALAVITLLGSPTPWLVIGLVFASGLGSGLSAPLWQAILPELVHRSEISLAAALASVNQNLSRAVGPALGGVLVAAAGPGWTFALNAVSFVAVIAVLGGWRREPAEHVLGPEHIVAAMRSGLAFARHEPRLRGLFARSLLFVTFAAALWAVLPVLARDELHLGSGGYGLLLGVVGAGAIVGAVVLARAARRPDQLIVVSSAAFAAACALCALVPKPWAVALALLLAGAAWIIATSVLNGIAIEILPAWVRSRGVSLYTLVFQGGQALSAIALGVVAQLAGARAALGAVAVGLVAGLAGQRRWPLPAPAELDVTPHPWPVEPRLRIEPHPAAGPILVLVEYRVEREHHDEFRTRMRVLGRARRRTGAERWGLFQDGADPECFVETFFVATWQEHLRQHGERSTADDRVAEAGVRALTVERRVRHLFFAYEN